MNFNDKFQISILISVVSVSPVPSGWFQFAFVGWFVEGQWSHVWQSEGAWRDGATVGWMFLIRGCSHQHSHRSSTGKWSSSAIAHGGCEVKWVRSSRRWSTAGQDGCFRSADRCCSAKCFKSGEGDGKGDGCFSCASRECDGKSDGYFRWASRECDGKSDGYFRWAYGGCDGKSDGDFRWAYGGCDGKSDGDFRWAYGGCGGYFGHSAGSSYGANAWGASRWGCSHYQREHRGQLLLI